MTEQFVVAFVLLVTLVSLILIIVFVTDRWLVL